MLAFFLMGCGGTTAEPPVDTAVVDTDDTGTPVDTDSTPPGVPCSADGNLEVVPLDIWGRDLDVASVVVTGLEDRIDDPSAGPGVALYPLPPTALALSVDWSAEEHLAGASAITWDSVALTVGAPGSGAVAWSRDTRVIDGRECPVHTVYLGAEHAWFAPSAAAPTRNTATLHLDGETYWEDVAGVLVETQERVTWATWWWESDFELLRPSDHATLSESERWGNTSLGLLESLDGVDRRILINRFWANNSDYTEYLNTDGDLRTYADAAGDGLEVVLQGNNTEVPIDEPYAGEAAPIDFVTRVAANTRYAGRAIEGEARRMSAAIELDVASWHQKAMVFDGATAFVGGMNTKASDWDTSAHYVYEPRRMSFDADADAREAVAYGEELPDLGPRKDYGVRLDGPAAADVEALLASRWDAAREDGSLYAENATPFTVEAPAAEPDTGPMVQVVATMPEPWATMAVAETHARAFQAATRYIYIEDQYFRAPMMNDLIVERMMEEPELVLIVVTKPVSDWDGGAMYTSISDQTFRDLFPDRYLLLQLRSSVLITDPDAWFTEAEVEYADIDTHSKMRLVDDRYLSVGSCNFNNRGYLYEGELDVAVLDEGFTTDARTRIFANLVGPEWEGLLTDDAANNLDVLRMASESNLDRLMWWLDNAGDLDAEEAEELWDTSSPSGFVYPLEVSDDYVFEVGPDAF